MIVDLLYFLLFRRYLTHQWLNNSSNSCTCSVILFLLLRNFCSFSSYYLIYNLKPSILLFWVLFGELQVIHNEAAKSVSSSTNCNTSGCLFYDWKNIFHNIFFRDSIDKNCRGKWNFLCFSPTPFLVAITCLSWMFHVDV